MKKFLISTLTATILLTAATPNEISNDLLKTLGGNLKTHLKKDGLINAFEFCAKNAYNLTNKIQQKYPNAKIQRISLKPRNVLDTPNKEDKAVLETFEKLNKDGIKPKEIIVKQGNKKIVYKPLYISKQVCLKCHGNINPNSKIGKVLYKYYPQDKATGYKLGDFRGAIKITLNNR